ncbi:MAG: flagellar hook assembly protein FlgD [Phycisphaerae bacterium]
METGAIGSSGGATATLSKKNDVNSLQSEDFFKLLITELQQQDPLEPTETADMIGQISRIRSIEQSDTLNTTLAQMTSQQKTAGASDMLNKYVVAKTTDGNGNVTNISGVVTGVRFVEDGTAMLDLDSGVSVRAQDVQTVTTPENAAIQNATTPEEKAAEAAKIKAANAKPLTILETPFFKIST